MLMQQWLRSRSADVTRSRRLFVSDQQRSGMQKKSPWIPPPDPDFEKLAEDGRSAWLRDKPSSISFDTDTEVLEFHDPAFCVTVGWEDEAHYFELDPFREWIREILEAAKTLIGHNIKFDLQKLCLAGLVTPQEAVSRWNLHDTEGLAHLDNEHREKGLKKLAVELLGVEVETIEVETQSGPNKGQIKAVPKEEYELRKAKDWAKKHYGFASVKDIGYHLLPRGVVVPYAIKDAEFTWELFTALLPRILRYEDLTAKYKQEMQTTRMLFVSEQHGMGVDESYVDKQSKVYRKKVLVHEKEIEKLVGKPVRSGKMAPSEKPLFFNPQSNPQIADFFLAQGHSRDNYDAEQLETIDHPLARRLVEYRTDRKILGTYLEGLRKGSRDGVFHPSTRQHGTVAGRTSSGKELG